MPLFTQFSHFDPKKVMFSSYQITLTMSIIVSETVTTLLLARETDVTLLLWAMNLHGALVLWTSVVH